jgi:hypothetical protein
VQRGTGIEPGAAGLPSERFRPTNSARSQVNDLAGSVACQKAAWSPNSVL